MISQTQKLGLSERSLSTTNIITSQIDIKKYYSILQYSTLASLDSDI